MLYSLNAFTQSRYQMADYIIIIIIRVHSLCFELFGQGWRMHPNPAVTFWFFEGEGMLLVKWRLPIPPYSPGKQTIGVQATRFGERIGDMQVGELTNWLLHVTPRSRLSSSSV